MTRKEKIYVIITVIITAIFLCLAVFHFNNSYLRLGETFVDLWNSIRIYFFEIFEIEYDIKATVEEYSKIFIFEPSIPDNLDHLTEDLDAYLRQLKSQENINIYIYSIGQAMKKASKVILIILPIILCLYQLLSNLYLTPNNDYGKETLPLKLYKWMVNNTVEPIKRLVIEYISFVKKYEKIWHLWLLIWLCNLNLSSVLIAFLSYYLYFSVSYKIDTLYPQFVKLSLDLWVFFDTIPLWCIAIFLCFCFDNYRRKVAKDILNHYEMRNRGFINSLPIVSMTCGSMGKKKTTLITDMALSQEVMFRNKAFELLKINDLRFPCFPWISFELDLRRAMNYGEVYNLASVKAWIKKKESRYLKHGDPNKRLYGYDVITHGDTYNDGLKIWTLFDVLSTYAQLYFIYVIESSLIVSNYAVRTDNELLDNGNFPIWMSDFFPIETRNGGHHAHILDFDVLRLGKKVIENNKNAGSFEFGVVLISEVGKERGNILDHKEIKKNQDETNQKNDLFNSWLKMCRHSATVNNYPFIKVFTDEQRPESWGADARDLCDIVHIVSSGPQHIALPFYTVEEMLAEWAFNFFISLYYKMRYLRGDTTLAIYLMKNICAALYRRNVKLYNQFGYCISHIEKERGTMDGKVEKKRYYLMNKKVYSSRFSTDCFSDYFNEMAKKTRVGLNDYIAYASEKATVEELKLQNSYFINALYKNSGTD